MKIKVTWESTHSIPDEEADNYDSANVTSKIIEEFEEDEFAFVEATEPVPVKAEIID